MTTDLSTVADPYTAAVLVSVVIPCHNSLRYLPETLDAVLDQRLPAGIDLEVVLVDDGGEDDLAEWAADRGDAEVRVVRQDNTGVSGARNRGIEESSGELVAFCDSDDVWLPNHTADLVACFRRDPGIGLAYGWYDVVDADGVPTGANRRGAATGWAWEELVLENPVGASGVIVARSALDDVGTFAVNRDRFPIDVEDWELWVRIAKSWRIALAPSVVYQYRRHDSNSSTDLESLDAAYDYFLEAVFDAGGDALPDAATDDLRAKAEANISMILAWQSLNDRDDPAGSLRYIERAANRWPAVNRTPEYWRLRVAAEALRRTGSVGYRSLRGANAAARRARDAAKRSSALIRRA